MISFCMLIFSQMAQGAQELPGLAYDHSMELQYATQFSVDYYQGGYALISIIDGDQFLVVPEGMGTPDGLDEDITVLQQPVSNIYLVATSAMDFFAAIDGMDAIRLSGTRPEKWYVEEAKEAMENGSIIYAGKYSAPDYELIVSEKLRAGDRVHDDLPFP